MLKTNTVNTIALLSICICCWHALYTFRPFCCCLLAIQCYFLNMPYMNIHINIYLHLFCFSSSLIWMNVFFSQWFNVKNIYVEIFSSGACYVRGWYGKNVIWNTLLIATCNHTMSKPATSTNILNNQIDYIIVGS